MDLKTNESKEGILNKKNSKFETSEQEKNNHFNHDKSEWYIETDTNQKIGPLNTNDLSGYLKAIRNAINGMNLCWRDGMDNWIEISQCEELKQLIVPKLDDEDVNNADNHGDNENARKIRESSDFINDTHDFFQYLTDKNCDATLNSAPGCDYLPLDEVDGKNKYISPEGIGYVLNPNTKLWITFAEYNRLYNEAKEKNCKLENHFINGLNDSSTPEQQNFSSTCLKRERNKENRKKYRERLKEKKKAGLWIKPKINPNVYISNLPESITEEELENIFKKAGIIKIDPDTSKPKIKIYRQNDGKISGDALIGFLNPVSVNLAITYLNNYEIRENHFIKVEQAQFNKTSLSSYNSPKDISKCTLDLKKKKYLAAKLEQQRLLSWTDGYSEGRIRIMILRPLWTYEEAKEYVSNDIFYSTISTRLKNNISQWSEVVSVTAIDRHPKGIVCVKFKDVASCEVAVSRFNMREYSFLDMFDREVALTYAQFKIWLNQDPSKQANTSYSIDNLSQHQVKLFTAIINYQYSLSMNTSLEKINQTQNDINSSTFSHVNKTSTLNEAYSIQSEFLIEFLLNHNILLEAYIYDGISDLKGQAIPNEETIDRKIKETSANLVSEQNTDDKLNDWETHLCDYDLDDIEIIQEE